MDRLYELLRETGEPPSATLPDWLEGARDSLRILREHLRGDVILYARANHVLIGGTLMPTANFEKATRSELDGLDILQDSSWVIQKSYGGGSGHRVHLEAPLESSGSGLLSGGEILVHRRSLHGVKTHARSIEISQKLVHSLDLYFLPERNAYCRLDSRGDIEDVIRIFEADDTDIRYVTIKEKDLHTYLALTDTVVFYGFDFTRFSAGSFNGWPDNGRFDEQTDGFYYRGQVSQGNASYVRGYTVLESQLTKEGLIEEWRKECDGTGKEYAEFKIMDRKNHRLLETSCSTDSIVNYFTESDLPWEISPAFFSPEVLHRFKSDPEKYTLEDRSIHCRNAWSLKTYDINEAGQVHTYIGYLQLLPYEEQLYWKAFNEWPKASISKSPVGGNKGTSS